MPKTILSCKYLSYKLTTRNPPVIIHLPLLHIRLSGSHGSLTTIALVDSGSTTTFVPLELAEMLSLPIHKEEEAVGAGGKFQNTIRNVKISILNARKPIWTVDAQVYVPTQPDRIPYVVLGRDYIFRKYDILFRENQQRLFLKAPKINKTKKIRRRKH